MMPNGSRIDPFRWLNRRITHHRYTASATRVRRRRKLRLAMSRTLARAVVHHPLGLNVFEAIAGPHRIREKWLAVDLRGLPAELAGLRVVQITDVHHGPWLPIEFVLGIVDRVNRLEPDLVVLTGDYVINSPRYVAPVVKAFGLLRASVGVVAVLGNHDWWEGIGAVRHAFSSAGIPLIDNSRLIVNAALGFVESGKSGLCVAGLGDFWEDKMRPDNALGGVPETMPRLVLSHNPDVAEDRDFLAAGHRVDLMVSGHTHGGQVRVPGLGTPVVPSLYGQKYAAGWVEGPEFPVYISNGIGTSGVPVRIGAHPEITVFELFPSPDGNRPG
jgi:hypothetical protein